MCSIAAALVALGGAICMVLLVQDLRRREVHVLPLVALGVAGLAYGWLDLGPGMWRQLLVNAGFVLLVLGLMWVVMKVRRPGRRILDAQLGTGDVALFFTVVGWLDPLGYVMWFVTGLVLVVLGVLAWATLGRWRADAPIPLAGLLAGYLVVFWPVYQWLGEAVAGLVWGWNWWAMG